MEKRTLLALTISFLVLGSYSMILRHFYPNYGVHQAKTLESSRPQETAKIENLSKQPVFSKEKDKEFKNDNLKLLFSEATGGIREVSFPGFVDSDTKAPLKIFSESAGDFSATSVTLGFEGRKKEETPVDFKITTSSDQVVQVLGVENGIKITKQYTFEHSKYYADMKINFQNISQAPVNFDYTLAIGPSFPPRHSIDGQYIEANFYYKVDGKAELRHIKETKLGKTVSSRGPVDWAAAKDRHFSVILKPKTDGALFTGFVRGLGNHKFGAALNSGKISLAPGASLGHDFVLYLGPNELEELEPVGLDPIVNFGKLDMIGRVLVGALEMLHKVFRNYGLSIIALTTFINLLLFPLTRVSYLSMKRMQLVQPQMNKLRDQHKKNPEKLNKEMMELYKKHKVNPFGGCLPMVLQMPVFIALYVALSKSVILINSKLLWIKDLSSPDSLSLPFRLPVLGNEIHVLPLVMVAGMFLQQKFTQIKMEGQDPAVESQQKMMATMMPVMFGFIFYAMPSGLVLYWLTNTIIMTSYQLYLKNITLT